MGMRAEKLEEKKKPKQNQELVLKTSEHGQLFAIQDGNEVKVFVRRCFPWSQPLEYISLRDAEDKEVALIRNIEELNSLSQQALLFALKESGFCFLVTDLLYVDEEFELRHWRVETQQGERTFQTKLTDWPREVPGGGLLIQDVYNDLYYIDNPESLSENGKKLLWSFLD